MAKVSREGLVAHFEGDLLVAFIGIRINSIWKIHTKQTGKAVVAEHVGRIVNKQLLERCTVLDTDGTAYVDFGWLYDSASLGNQFNPEDRREIEKVPQQDCETVSNSLRLIYRNDDLVEAIALRFSATRSRLNRRIDSFCSIWHLAA